MLDALPYREIVLCDFEFTADPGERPGPVCLVAKLLRAGRTIRLRKDQFGSVPPYPIDAGSLFVAYYASAELGCHRVLGWPMPARILDLFIEFRDRTNGLATPAGSSLLGALTYFGLDAIGVAEKKEMRRLIMEGGPWSAEEWELILAYCQSDVEALARLLPAMLPRIDLPRALLRGRYMAAASAIEHNGSPIDVETLGLFRAHWFDIQDQLIADIDEHGVYDGRTFRADHWARLLVCHNFPWPTLESGQLDLSDDVFREMAKAYPLVSPYRELRSSLSDLRLNDLAVGRDGRNRTILSAFRARTGRNQPSNAKYIFGPSVWLRGLVQPPPGHGIAYLDFKTQEFAIAAALSGDVNMQAAYRTGNPYLAFGKKIGAVPTDANKATHPSEHALFKAVVLGIGFGMEAESLARRIGRPPIVARDLLRAHHETYSKFWRWSDAAVDQAMITGSLHTVFGWHVHVGENVNPRSLRNFPMQANGSEMLRLACCLATEAGIEVCGPVHDAILICAPLDRLDADVEKTRALMTEASRIVLDGFEVGTDADVIKYPHRIMDPRGVVMWDRVTRLVAERQAAPKRVRAINVGALLHWMEEREAIRIRKESGAPLPWTDAPILRDGSFCNVRREDDKATRWITKHWRTPHADDPDFWFACCVARFVNLPDTLAEIGYPVPWDPEHFLAVMADRKRRGKTVYGPAYTIFAGKGYADKPSFHAERLFGPLWEARAYLRPKRGDTLARYFARLSDYPGMGGGFMPAQIIADLKYVEPLRSALDWATFVVSGPGSKRGLNRVLGRPADTPWAETEWRAEFDRLWAAVAPDLQRLGLSDLHAQDKQSVLCETDKYLRVQSGEGRMKRHYKQQKAA
jgi:DNA polymerase I